MNKMVILDIQKNYAICMKNDGSVCRIKNKNYYVGEEIIMNRNIKQTFRKLSYAVAAMVIIVSGSAFAATKVPHDYVSLDVNPSVQYTVNIFGDVISVEGVNQDGEAVLENIDVTTLEGQDIETALAHTLIQIAKDGYVSTIEDPLVVIATSSNDEAENKELVQKVNQEISDIMDDERDDSEEDIDEDGNDLDEDETTDQDLDEILEDIEVEVVGVGRQRVLEARELGITPGKLNLIEKYIAASGDEEVDILEWSNKSVKEIQKSTQLAKGIGNKKDNKNESGDDNKPEDNDDSLNEDVSSDDEKDSDEECEEKSDDRAENEKNKDKDKEKSNNSNNSNKDNNGKSSNGNGNSGSNGKKK